MNKRTIETIRSALKQWREESDARSAALAHVEQEREDRLAEVMEAAEIVAALEETLREITQ